MKLSQLAWAVPGARRAGRDDIEISTMVYDSRQAGPGALFVAVKGFKSDGNAFVPQALANGAAAVAVEGAPLPGLTVPQLVVPQARRALSLLAQEFYGHPAQGLRLVGITGTNGKTSISYLTAAVCAAAGMRPGIIGTIAYRIGNRVLPAPNTTPESLDLQKHLADMRQAGLDTCVMEVSSHALALDRLHGLRMDGAVFTNLTRDHLDFHATLEEYGAAKTILFEKLCDAKSAAVLNADDPFTAQIKSRTRARVSTYGLKNAADIRAESVEMTAQGTRLQVATPAGRLTLNMQLLGEFNVYNTLAALGIGLALGFEREAIVRGLEGVAGVRGRFESLTDSRGVTAVIDYAHTPDALEKILVNARKLCTGQLVVVFGCGGDRDRGKRPLMGELATRLADRIVITSDNPRTEEPNAIIDEIVRGISGRTNYTIEADRRRAIELALAGARANDLVVMAGKGHEDYQIIGTVKHHFDDREEIERIFKQIANCKL
jgi:UDP-N-acetylmuramoyl-L-alanyl-D-glutamate--2,6-diaminopimelate ligase